MNNPEPGVGVQRSAWVQPILVSKGGSHLSTIAAAARASALAYLADAENPAWESWLDGPFTKTVRRVTHDKLAAAQAAARERGEKTVRVDVEGSSAVAYAPLLAAELPREVARAQVSGTDFPLDDTQPCADGSPFTVMLDSALTTGKASAQAAHAVWIWMLSRLTDNPEQVREWAARGAPARIELVRAAVVQGIKRNDFGQDGLMFVHDAGWTEVEPGSLTAVVLPW